MEFASKILLGALYK
jgi:hypothetical protein